MAVDSKQGTSPTNGTQPNGATANGQRTKGGRKRPSSLMQQASSLPTVEHSLEEFIAKANQTLVDVSTWGNASDQAREEDEKVRAADLQRMKAAESQLREGEAREHSLRRQLDGLQGKLAEAEARAAVAGTSVGSAAHDQTLQQLRQQISQAEAQRKAFDDEKKALARALAEAREEAAIARTSATAMSFDSGNDSEASERVRLAEAKATKAIAAARAAQAGLTVSPADIAAIESGLVVTAVEQRKGFPWVAILLAFAGGLAIMFGVWKLVLSKDTKAAPAAVVQPAATQPAAAPAPAPAPSKPVVTPIEEPTPTETAPAAAAVDDKAAAPAAPIADDKPPAVDPSATDKAAAAKAAADAAKQDKADKAAAAKEAAALAKQEKADKAAALKAEKASAKSVKPTKAASAPKATKAPTTKPTTGGIADPFGETPKKGATKPAKPAAKPAGGIVDPF